MKKILLSLKNIVANKNNKIMNLEKYFTKISLSFSDLFIAAVF